MTSVKYRVLKKMKSGSSLPLSIWLHSSNQSPVSESPTKFPLSQGFVRLDWEKTELTVYYRNHLNRLKHMSPDHSLDFEIRHQPYTNIRTRKVTWLTRTVLCTCWFLAAAGQFNDVLGCMFFRHQHTRKVVSFHLPTPSIRLREILHCQKSLIANVQLEVCLFDAMRQAFGRRRKLVTFLFLLVEK